VRRAERPHKPTAEHTPKATQAVPIRLTALRRLGTKNQRRCKAVTRYGERCKCAPVHGTKFCLLHTGDTASRMGTKGGRRRAIYNPDGLEPFTRPQNAGEMQMLLAQTIVEVRSGKMDPRVANTIAYLGTAFLSALETWELENRVQALEARSAPHFAGIMQ
jgi:hypothetical protein